MKTRFFLLFMFISGFLLSAQTVTTITDGTPDDAINLDSNGNIYVSNFDGGKIFKFTPSGVMTEFLTGLSNPNGLAFNSSDELYSCQWQTNFLNKYLISGNLSNSYSVTWGNPSGIAKAFDNEDMIFAKYSANTLHRITPSGTITTISTAGELNGPVGLTYDDSGNLYVGNYNNRRIYKVLTNGNLEYVATVGSSSFLGFITFANGKLWATVFGEHKIYTIDPSKVDDVTLFAGSVQGTNDGELSQATFNTPNGIKFNDAGDTMYISEYNTKNLRIISNIPLSVNDFQNNSDLKIITNSGQKYLSLSGSIFESGQYEIAIYNLLGQKTIELNGKTQNSSNEIKINTNNLSEGTYIVMVKSNGLRESKKVIVNH